MMLQANALSLPNINMCAIPPGGGSYSHGIGNGVVLDGGGSTPTCNAFKACPCCTDCAQIIAKLDSVSAGIAGISALNELRFSSLNPENYTVRP